MRYVYPLFLATWLVGLGVEWVQITRAQTALRQTVEAYDQATQNLNQDRTRLMAVLRQAKQSSQESEFLQGLVNVLPQEKGFIRTQRAISEEVDALRQKVGRRLHDELHIVVDTQANKLYLKKGLTLLWQADCSVGRGGMLFDRKTGRRWEFTTPRGQFEILDKMAHPIWIKPDWAFVESREPIPPPGDPKRKVPGELGAYVFNLGDGYLIHGTQTEALLGSAVSHGCVRLGATDLKNLYENVPVGTKVYIY